MKISWNWLTEILPIEISIEKATEILTTIGLEVEGIEDYEEIPGGLEGIVVGKIIACDKHPNADKLSLTLVDINDKEPSQIVCGAPNVALGQTVAVATVGSTLYPMSGEPFKIKKAKIRGERSFGMICAEDEIGLGKSHDGIMVLSDEYAPGTPLSEVFPIGNDKIIDIGLTPNRGDATSHFGVARDLLAALQAREGLTASLELPEHAKISSHTIDDWQVIIEDKNACPRYSAVVLEQVKIGESPDYIKQRLKSLGINLINNVVDITNYVMLEMGQPLHAFDAEKIAHRTVRVGFLKGNESFRCLDDQVVELKPDDLMIKDGENRPMCIAGVYGGKDSETSVNTKTVFLESAFFDPKHIRSTSMHHLFRTNAANIYEKHSDPEITVRALERAVFLLNKYAGAKLKKGLIDKRSKVLSPAKPILRLDRLNQLAGTEIQDETVARILKALEIKIVEKSGTHWSLEVPLYRSDVQREIDVIEDVIRIYGFENIPKPANLSTSIEHEHGNSPYELRSSIGRMLTGCGYTEMMNVSLTKDSFYDNSQDSLVYINNTSNAELNVMRMDLLHPGLESLAHNLNRNQRNLKFFEFGNVYRLQGSNIEEQEQLILLTTGQRFEQNWLNNEASQVEVFDILGLFDAFFSMKNLIVEKGAWPDQNEFRQAFKYCSNGSQIAWGGQIKKEILELHGIDEAVFCGVLDFSSLKKKKSGKNLIAKPVSKYPTIERHLAIRIKDNVKFNEIQSVIRKRGGKLVSVLDLFDVYTDDAMREKGEKSYAVSIVFSRTDRTLNDGEIDKVMKKILQGLEQDLSAVIRK
jgi:phenylalanyl-tRNA synthetase beta chain